MAYKCSCGFETRKMGTFVAHFRYNKGNGDHTSVGRAEPPEVPTEESPAEGGSPEAPAKKAAAKEASAGKPTTVLAEAHTIAVYPKQFTMSSTLLWQAREAAIREWGWPQDIRPEDFLDTFLHLAFFQRGILLQGYTVLKAKEGDNGSG